MLNDLQLAKLGNKFFNLKKTELALICFSAAIVSTWYTYLSSVDLHVALVELCCTVAWPVNIFQEKSPETSLCYQGRGHCYWKMGDLEKASTDFQKAAQIDPSCLDCWLNLSEVYLQMGKSDEAKKGTVWIILYEHVSVLKRYSRVQKV